MASYHEVVKAAAHRGVDVREHAAVNHRLGLFLRVDEFEVVGLEGEVEQHATEIAHVEDAVHHQRLLARAVEVVVVEGQTAVAHHDLLLVGS